MELQKKLNYTHSEKANYNRIIYKNWLEEKIQEKILLRRKIDFILNFLFLDPPLCKGRTALLRSTIINIPGEIF